MKQQDSEFRFFVLNFHGRAYGGWYRLIDSDRMEVLAPGFHSTVMLDRGSPEVLSCQVLEQFIRVRVQQGAPLPSMSVYPNPLTPDHVCEDPAASH